MFSAKSSVGNSTQHMIQDLQQINSIEREKKGGGGCLGRSKEIKRMSRVMTQSGYFF